MGNCCGRGSSSMVWGLWADNDEAEESSRKISSSSSSLSSPLKNSIASHGGGGSIRGVKIKITKKELEELLSNAELQGLSSEQVLNRLITASYQVSVEHDHHHQPWQPSLKSIPEVD